MPGHRAGLWLLLPVGLLANPVTSLCPSPHLQGRLWEGQTSYCHKALRPGPDRVPTASCWLGNTDLPTGGALAAPSHLSWVQAARRASRGLPAGPTGGWPRTPASEQDLGGRGCPVRWGQVSRVGSVPRQTHTWPLGFYTRLFCLWFQWTLTEQKKSPPQQHWTFPRAQGEQKSGGGPSVPLLTTQRVPPAPRCACSPFPVADG